MDILKTPPEKFDCLLQCSNIISDILNLTSVKEEAQGADAIIPCFIYVLLKAQPKKLISNLNYISTFSDKNKMMA